MVDQEGTPLRRRYVCSKDGKELDWDEIVRGYEVKKGKFVVVTDDELEAIEPRKTRDIDLKQFVDADEIDPMSFVRAYYLVPTGGTNKAYRLLADVMERSGRVGIATFVMRAKEYLVAILAEKGILRAETLRFADEVRTPDEIGLPKPKKPAAAAVRKFESAISRHSGKFNLREMLDDEAKKIEQVAESKQKKHVGVVKTKEPVQEQDESGGEVVDLMKVLQNALREGKGGSKRRAPKRAPRRASTKHRARKAR